jgi:hypothetical protein
MPGVGFSRATVSVPEAETFAWLTAVTVRLVLEGSVVGGV